MLKFYMTPGSCSTGIHILLEELELLFEVHLVNLLAGDNTTPGYLALNPKGTIPVLVCDDGRVLSEYPSIAYWLARTYPKAGLLGASLDDEVRVLELMDYVVATLHIQGFARIFTTDKFTPNAANHEVVKQQGKAIIDKAFSVINSMLAGQDYVLKNFSIADTALFYTEFWATRSGIELPEHCQRHYQLMLQRPAVRRVLLEEGYRLPGAA